MTQAFDLIIFGGTGDLSCKKLLPALFSGWKVGNLPADSRIFLTTRTMPKESVFDWLIASRKEHLPDQATDESDLKAFAKMVTLVSLNLKKGGNDWADFSTLLHEESDRPITHFLAIPPSVFTSVCDLLANYGLNSDRCRLVLEKPLGHDQASAMEINGHVAKHFKEKQTFRIDHYLGKEAVQNLIALRFSNILFEKLWDNNTVDHVQITIAEDLGLHGRGDYYEGIGALRDMVQNHLLQLLCLVAMEAPAKLDAAGIREEKLKVLKSLQPITKDRIKQDVVMGQYGSGAMHGKAVGSYTDDLSIEGDSVTETFVAIKAHIENWRWAGVPFYLRTGKRLPDRFAEIVIQFKDVPHKANQNWTGGLHPNRFIIHLQPEDRLALRLMIKDHTKGEDALKESELNLDVSDNQRLGPYLRLILAASAGDQSLFVHRSEVEEAWKWIDGIEDHWQSEEVTPLPYAAGTWGPYEADALMRNDGRKWFHESRG